MKRRISPVKEHFIWNRYKGKKAQQEFKTDVQRIHRAAHVDARMDAKFRKSHTTDLIQLADVMAYALSRQARGSLKYHELEQLLNAFKTDERNLIYSSKMGEE